MAVNTLRDRHLLDLEIACNESSVDPHVMDAIIHAESAWNTWAVRYERNWTYYAKPDTFAKVRGISSDTERALQRMSWGLGQVMGGTARALGFVGDLAQLCDPEIGLHWACTYFKSVADEHVRIEDAIAAYNAGSVRKTPSGLYVNQAYVDNVMAFYDSLSAGEYTAAARADKPAGS